MNLNLTRPPLGVGAISVIAFSVLATSALAGDWYAEVRGGASLVSNASETGGIVEITNDYNTGYSISGALGYSFADHFRTDLEFSHRRAGNSGGFTENVQAFVPCGEFAGDPCLDPATRGRVSAQSVMANAYYDFMTEGRFRPYLGAGVGVARVDMNIVTTATLNDAGTEDFSLVDGDKTSFAWQVAAGTGFVLSEGLLLTVGYRYFQGGSPSIPGHARFTPFALKDTFESHSLEAGLRVRF